MSRETAGSLVFGFQSIIESRRWTQCELRAMPFSSDLHPTGARFTATKDVFGLSVLCVTFGMGCIVVSGVCCVLFFSDFNLSSAFKRCHACVCACTHLHGLGWIFFVMLLALSIVGSSTASADADGVPTIKTSARTGAGGTGTAIVVIVMHTFGMCSDCIP